MCPRLYLVSVGSNPTGVTISPARRREIYDVCVKFGKFLVMQAHSGVVYLTSADLILVEDDPYYFLQYPRYQTPSSNSNVREARTSEEFLSSLTPSFLSMDTQGRVIRLESFSKTLFPGLRLGYFIANSLFTERLLRATEVETQDPAGLSQAFVLSLFHRWGIDGYLTWLQSLQLQYFTRRNWLLDAFSEHFTLVPAKESPLPTAEGLVACISRKDAQLVPVFSFVDPTAGMFVWTKWYFSTVPRFLELEASGQEDPEQAFAEEVWKAMATELVLLTPGSYYHPWQGADKVSTAARGAEAQQANFRFSFATPTVCPELAHEL